MKKLLLTLGTAGATLAPLATVIACGTSTALGPVDVKGVEYDATKTALVTDAGDVTDKSFNEQAFNALKTINSGTTEAGNVNKPAGHSAAEISAGYEAMVTAGNNTILAPGFYHVDAITSFNQNNGDEVANFILVDGVVESANTASITYQTQDAGFMAGYLAGLYLEGEGDTNPTVGTFGGGNFPGVTDFMVGFVNGVMHFNGTNDEADVDVKFATLGTDEAYTNTGFAPGGGTANSDALVTAGADIILPVAGPQTADAIKAFEDGGVDGKIIGVDTDQILAYPDDSNYFITSILKNLEKSFVDVANVIGGATIAGVNGLGETTVGTLDNGLVGIADNPNGTSYYPTATADDIKDAAKAASADATINTWAASLAIIKANA